MALCVAAGFVNQTPLDWDGNLARLGQVMDLARQEGVSALCLPELTLSGYGCEDLFLSTDFRERCLKQLRAALPLTKGLLTVLGLPFEHEGRIYNCAALVADGQLLGLVPKQHLALQGLHYEPRWFTPWVAGQFTSVNFFGATIPFGDLIFDLGPLVLGLEICEDAWANERPAPRLIARGVNLIFCPAASHFALGKTKQRRQLAQQAGTAYLYANLMGNEAGRVIYDGGATISDSHGVLVAQGARFSYQESGLVAAPLSLSEPKTTQDPGRVQSAWRPTLIPDPIANGGLSSQVWEDQPFEELSRAISLGLHDYLRKSHARGFALSLSGGVDSGACAVFTRWSFEWALEALGWDDLRSRLKALPGVDRVQSVEQAMPIYLRTLYQATLQSSKRTQAAADDLALALGGTHATIDIQPLVDSNQALVESVLGRRLDWKDDDLSLQNLQARTRSPLVWALANAEGRLLLATNNRSEAAAGYTTMDGDSSGGLAPLAGVGKDFLRNWSRWAQTQGPSDLGPVPALAAINAQEPTAELRPLDQAQTDESDLMPYRVLDVIEREAIAKRQGPLRVFEEATRQLNDIDPLALRTWVGRFFRLWAVSQWKRERLAPSFHVDDHNVDPRSWTRFPILNGAWESELKELEA